jgi:uncharacterized membrane protein
MIYLSLKALHIYAVILLIGGILMAAQALAYSARNGEGAAGVLALFRRWDKLVTTPAMGAVWALGLYLIYDGGWWPDGWLIAKLVLVTVLSALHGNLSKNLRRRCNDPQSPLTYPPEFAIAATLLGVLLVVVLVAAKPF